MKKIFRIIKEGFFALVSYKNPLTYFKSRLGLFKNQKVTISLKNGISYVINSGTTEIRVIDEIWRLKVYDPRLASLGSRATIIDIGANIGVFSIKAANQAKDARVFSFEPFPRNFEMLKENITLNHLEGRITPFQLAVSSITGEEELFFRPYDSGGGSFKRYGDESELSSIKVKTTTLKSIFEENRIEKCDFIKIDCEGAEEEILTTAPAEILNKISIMTIEWHHTLNKMTTEEFMAFLRNAGFEVAYNHSTLTLYAWKDQ